jgi:hypothetical protein
MSSKSKRSRKARATPRKKHSHLSLGEVQPNLESLTIPPLQVLLPRTMTLRFALTAGVTTSHNFTCQQFLDLYAIAVGGSSAPVRMFNAMRLKSVKLWAGFTDPSTTSIDPVTQQVGIELASAAIAGYAGAPRIPITDSYLTHSKMGYAEKRPRKGVDLAAEWFTAQQTSYTLFNIVCPSASILQVEFNCMDICQETPGPTSVTSSLAKGTVGVTNFSLTGCRSLGMVNLVSP